MPSASAVRSRVPAHSSSPAVQSGPPAWLVRQLMRPKPDMPRIAARAAAEPEAAAALVAGVASTLAPVRLGSARALWLAAGIAPEALYPLFDFFVGQLDSA